MLDLVKHTTFSKLGIFCGLLHCLCGRLGQLYRCLGHLLIDPPTSACRFKGMRIGKTNPHMALPRMNCSLHGTSMWSCALYYKPTVMTIWYNVMSLEFLNWQLSADTLICKMVDQKPPKSSKMNSARQEKKNIMFWPKTWVFLNIIGHHYFRKTKIYLNKKCGYVNF